MSDPSELPPAAPAPHDPAALAQLHVQALDELGPPSLLADAQGRVLHVSPRAARFLQVPAGAFNANLQELVQPGLREAALQAWSQAATSGRAAAAGVGAGGEPVSLRVVRLAGSGAELRLVAFEPGPVSVPAKAASPAGADPTAAFAGVADWAVFGTDLDGRLTSWNTGAERLLGYDARHALGRGVDELSSPQERETGLADIDRRKALDDGHVAIERVLRRHDGSLFWAGGLVVRLQDAGGRATGCLHLLRDLAGERNARESLARCQGELVQSMADVQRARADLEAADAAKDRFLAVLSHELRNPLASIASAAELLLMPKLPAAAREKAANVVQRQARAMKSLLDELLDASRLTVGRLTLSRRPVSIASVIQAALETSRPLVQAAGHELAVNVPPQEIEVDGDPARLAQVVSNLVGNAAKYTPEGGRIRVSAEVFHDEVVIAVEDNGIGMEPSQIDRMFDLFARGGDTPMNRSTGGLGIGLPLARNIVELHGGWIMASSAGPGHGTQLRVGLPLLRVTGPRPPLEAPPVPQQPTAAPAAEGELVLVADDNADAAWGMGKLLELSGYRATLARSGEEALRVAEQLKPAVALLDIGMPDLSGHEVARRLRAQAWGRPMILIAVTGWGQDVDIQASLQAGFDAHLTKPLNVARITAAIEELMGQQKR